MHCSGLIFSIGQFFRVTQVYVFYMGYPAIGKILTLRAPDPKFDWSPHLKGITEVFAQFSLKLIAQPRPRMASAIREALLKDDSLASQLDLSFAGVSRRKLIKIKLEVDINPPARLGEATTFLDFSADCEVRHQDLASNFAQKIQALLCRCFLKGRDWFDFSWYVSRGVTPNLVLLQNALVQAGP